MHPHPNQGVQMSAMVVFWGVREVYGEGKCPVETEPTE